jgi:hypothetical protein
MISERAAAQILADAQGLGREQARQLLLTGASGHGVRLGRSTTYDEEMVRDLAARPPAGLSRLAEACPHGVYVARMRRGRPFDVAWPWDRQAEALAAQPPMPALTRALVVHVPIGAYGGIPWVATVSGLVVFAGVATHARLDESQQVVFGLQPPTSWSAPAWADAVERRWFHIGPGRHWFWWHPDRLAPDGWALPV